MHNNFCTSYPHLTLSIAPYPISSVDKCLQSNFSFQIDPVPVKVSSDVPEIAPLTLTHLAGPLALHALILALATLVWLAELCYVIWQKRKRNRASQIKQSLTVVQPRDAQL